VPDSNLVHGQTYRRVKGGSYVEDHVLVERGSKVTQSAVGRGTEIRAGSEISGSVIGRRCKIGKNVRIENSYIWDDAVIGDGSSVVHSVLADSVAVGPNCRIPAGSLISYNVEIDQGIQLQSDPTARISLLTDEKQLAKTDISLVGQCGKGALYEVVIDNEDSDDEEEENRDPAILQSSLIYSLEGLNISTSSISTLASDDDYDSDDDASLSGSLHAGDHHFDRTRDRLSSFTSDDASKPDTFHSDAVNGLVDALRADDNEDFDSAKLEFMGLRLANNASDSAMRRAIAVAFVRRAAELLTPELGGLEPTKAAEKAITSKKGAPRFIRDVAVGGEDVAQQVEFGLALQKGLLGVRDLESGRAGALLAAMLQQFYSLDVLEVDGIVAWWADKRAGETEEMNTLKEKCRVLVEWLENADEEESDDDEESEEDDDDESD
jgi:translation initiation factor eIF-2B subunit epsilon